jgi:hypothetical protein
MTRGAVLVVVALAIGGGLRAYTHNTTANMPMPKRTGAKADGRFYAVVQLCWRPAQVSGHIGYIIGPIDQAVGANDVDCRTPFERKGLVSPGDRVSVSWATDAVTTLAGTKYRIVINNRVAIEGEDRATVKLYACIVGTPPC